MDYFVSLVVFFFLHGVFSGLWLKVGVCRFIFRVKFEIFTIIQYGISGHNLYHVFNEVRNFTF